jgi:hypothetical protein
MGASGWQYFVPYEEDINNALNKLKQEVFESGKYYSLWDVMQDEKKKYEMTPKNQLSKYEKKRLKFLKKYRNIEKPSNIDELLNSMENQELFQLLISPNHVMK